MSLFDVIDAKIGFIRLTSVSEDFQNPKSVKNQGTKIMVIMSKNVPTILFESFPKKYRIK